MQPQGSSIAKCIYAELDALFGVAKNNRKQQLDRFYGMLLKHALFVYTSLEQFRSRIEQLIADELFYISYPNKSANKLLESEWLEIHNEIIAHLRESASGFKWDGLRDQLTEIRLVDHSNRAVWMQQCQMLAHSIAVCESFKDAEALLSGGIPKMLDETVSHMAVLVADLTKTLTPN